MVLLLELSQSSKPNSLAALSHVSKDREGGERVEDHDGIDAECGIKRRRQYCIAGISGSGEEK